MSAKRTYVEGREDQYREMLQQLGTLEGKYKGVRGELLAKVRTELEKLKPNAAGLSMVPAAPPSPVTGPVASYPSCRVCGRDMKLNGTDGRLVCQNGHTR
jgi:hypothetical protein